MEVGRSAASGTNYRVHKKPSSCWHFIKILAPSRRKGVLENSIYAKAFRVWQTRLRCKRDRLPVGGRGAALKYWIFILFWNLGSSTLPKNAPPLETRVSEGLSYIQTHLILNTTIACCFPHPAVHLHPWYVTEGRAAWRMTTMRIIVRQDCHFHPFHFNVWQS